MPNLGRAVRRRPTASAVRKLGIWAAQFLPHAFLDVGFCYSRNLTKKGMPKPDKQRQYDKIGENFMRDAKDFMLANIEMKDVVDAFNRISMDGTRVFYETPNMYPTLSEGLFKSHFKGIAAYRNQLIFTHTDLLAGAFHPYPGKILVANKQTSGDQASISAIYDTTPYHKGWSHPCSAQACGSYMAMGLQNTDDNTSFAEIHILDLTPLDNGAQPVNVTTINSVIKSGVTTTPLAVNGVAMTKEHGDQGRYIVAGVQANALTIYKSFNAYLDPANKADQFYVAGDTIQNFPQSGAGLALITQTDGSIYLIAMNADDDGNNNALYLFKLTISDSQVDCIQITSKTMMIPGLSEAVRYATGPALIAITAQDAATGLFLSGFSIYNKNTLNTSFRWGKGLEITSPEDIKVYATDRDDLTTSRFIWPVSTKKDFSLVTWSTHGQTSGPILPLSGLTVIYFAGSQGPELRLYYQTISLAIQEYGYSSGSWATGSPLAGGVSNSSVAAITWNDGNGLHIRFYFQAPNGDIQECGDDGNGWSQSSTIFSGAAPGTAISAIAWQDGSLHLRVYVQMPNGDIQECLDDGNGWQSGKVFSGAAPGTAISAVAWQNSGLHLRVYVQMPNGDIQECLDDGNGWQSSKLLSGAALGTAISAIAWQDRILRLRVYVQMPNGDIQECLDDGNGWQSSKLFSCAASGTAISAVAWQVTFPLQPPMLHLRVYVETETAPVQEYCFDGNGWNAGAVIR